MKQNDNMNNQTAPLAEQRSSRIKKYTMKAQESLSSNMNQLSSPERLVNDTLVDKNELEQQEAEVTIPVEKKQSQKRVKEKSAGVESSMQADKKNGRWSQQEKDKFIDALKLFGKDWKKVEQHIQTRSGAQIRSHAQKFFLNIEKTKSMDIDQYIAFVQTQNGGVITTPMQDLGGENQINIASDPYLLNQAKAKNTTIQDDVVSQNQSGFSDILQSSHHESKQFQNDLSFKYMNSKTITPGKEGADKISPSVRSSLKQLDETQKYAKFMDKQNSAVKGAMSLFSSVPPTDRKQKLRLSPTKIGNKEFISEIRENASQAVELQNGCNLIHENLDLSALDINFSEMWALNGIKLDTATYSTSLPAVSMVDENEQMLPECLNKLHTEVNNLGFGFYNELFLQKKRQNNEFEISQIQDQSVDAPIIMIYVQDKPTPKPASLKINSIQDGQKYDIELVSGTCLTFSSNCSHNYSIEFCQKKLSNSSQRMLLTFRQFEINDFAKIGKTPSFGAINHTLLPTNLFSDLNRQQKSTTDAAQQQQQIDHTNLLLNSLGVPGITNALNQFGMDPNIQLQNIMGNLKNQGIGPQGRERAQSSHSGFIVAPTFKQQAESQSIAKLMFSKMSEVLKNTNQQQSAGQVPSIQGIPAQPPNPVAAPTIVPVTKRQLLNINPMQTLSPQQQKEKTKANDLMNLLKPLLDKKNQVQVPPFPIKQSPTVQRPEVNNNLASLLSMVLSNKGGSKSPNVTNAALPQKQFNMKQTLQNQDTVSNTNKAADILLQNMLKSQAPQFPGRGISEMSGLSGLSRQKAVQPMMSGLSATSFFKQQSQQKAHLQEADIFVPAPIIPKFNQRPSGGSGSSGMPSLAVQKQALQSIDEILNGKPPTVSALNAKEMTGINSVGLNSVHIQNKEFLQSQKQQIHNLETQKQSLYLNFINDLSSYQLNISNSSEFIQNNLDQYSKIQGKFLEIYHIEINHYHNSECPLDGVKLQQIKNMVNQKIIQNMLELMNIQTLLNLILRMSQQMQSDQQIQQTRLKEIPIIPLKTFKELLPDSFIQHVHSELEKIQSPIEHHSLNKSVNLSDDSSSRQMDQSNGHGLNKPAEQLVEAPRVVRNPLRHLDSMVNIEQPVEIQKELEQIQEEQTPQDVKEDDFEKNDEIINQINLSRQTLKNIAHSLSPEPEKLLQQTIGLSGMPIEEIANIIGQKRTLKEVLQQPQIKSIYECQEQSPQRDDVVEPPTKRQRISPVKETDNIQSDQKLKEPDTDARKNFDDVGQVLQGLLQQQKENTEINQITGKLATPLKKEKSVVPYADNGVRIGGYRQAAYSDSHQEIVKTVSRLSADDIRLLGSASKKETIANIRKTIMKQASQVKKEEQSDLLKQMQMNLAPPVIKEKSIQELEQMDDIDPQHEASHGPVEDMLPPEQPIQKRDSEDTF